MDDLLKALPYWNNLSADEKKRAGEAAYVRRYSTGEPLFGPCVDCVGMIHILKGEARAYMLSDEGREVTLYHLAENDDCILSASCVLSSLTLEAHMNVTKPSELLIVPTALFGDFCRRNVHVRCFAYELAARRFSSVVSMMERTFFARIDKRLADYLLGVYRSTGKPEIRTTQEQLAARVNSVRETVGRTLKRFAEGGIIEIRRGAIILRDVRRLDELAEQ